MTFYVHVSIIDIWTIIVKNELVTAKNEERVIAAATTVFLRYGFKRVTMADIAEAAGMSRPALYLVYPSKEDILRAVVAQLMTGLLAEIREGLSRFATVEEKLAFAFEVWNVRPFEMLLASPDAKDLYESTFQFASDVTDKAAAEFVKILLGVLDPLVRKRPRLGLSAVQVAKILANAVPGFKASAKTSTQLREMIAGLITVVIASLKSAPEARRPHGKSAKS